MSLLGECHEVIPTNHAENRAAQKRLSKISISELFSTLGSHVEAAQKTKALGSTDASIDLRDEFYLREEQVETRDASFDEVGALLTEECDSKGPGRGQRTKSEKVAKTTCGDLRNKGRKEEGARSRRAMPSSFAKSKKTNEQTKTKMVVPAEVPHDTRLCIEDHIDIDESDVDRLRD